MIEFNINFNDRLFEPLRMSGVNAPREFDAAVRLCALKIHAIATKGISKGSRTGKITKKGVGTHQASAPGEYPKTDTTRLVTSIRTDFRFLSADVGSDVDYSSYLEKGTSRMKPRPWLQPSIDAAQPAMQVIIDKALKRVMQP